MENKQNVSIYTVRKMSKSANPADTGPALKQFMSWEEAKKYSEILWKEQIKNYISIRRKYND